MKHLNKFITFPNENQTDEIKVGFYKVAEFPNVIGLIDGTHVQIIAPAVSKDLFKNQKGYTSINVQGVCNDKGLFIHIYADWPGSAHGARVYRESNLVSLDFFVQFFHYIVGFSYNRIQYMYFI